MERLSSLGACDSLASRQAVGGTAALGAGGLVRRVPPMMDEPLPRTVISTFSTAGLFDVPLFSGAGALAAEGGALAEELQAEPLDEPGEGQIEVVSTEEEVLADGGAGEFDQVALRETLMSVKSLVPPPTSQMQTVWPSNRVFWDSAKWLAIQE